MKTNVRKLIIQNATLKGEVENKSKDNNHVELNKKVQSEKIKRKDEFSKTDKRQTCTESKKKISKQDNNMVNLNTMVWAKNLELRVKLPIATKKQNSKSDVLKVLRGKELST